LAARLGERSANFHPSSRVEARRGDPGWIASPRSQ
jgi:hypothetical protein